jgi:acetate---CoA ligase (ADP-forming)
MHPEFLPQLFSPRSVAIVGASERNPYARSALARIEACGYEGAVHLVNPRSPMVFGRKAYSRATELPGPIEMAFVCVPAPMVADALEDCAAMGAKAAVIISNGFGESHEPGGAALQQRLHAFLERTPMAVCGPACLGVLNLHGKFQAFGGRTGVEIHPGGIALVSQSGANVHTFIAAALARNLGFGYMASCGNEVGLELAEYIEYFIEDPRTRVVCAYAESIRTPARFIRAARRARELGKPIVIVKIGRSDSSNRAALAHTGAITGPDELFQALFREHAVLRADSIEEALDRAAIFAASEPRWWLRGRRVGLVSISGGFAAALSDLSTASGFEVPEFGAATIEALGRILPPNVNPQNPIDISTQVQRDRPQAWADTFLTVAADPQVDTVLAAEAVAVPRERVRTLLELREQQGKPVLLATTSPHIDVFDADVRALCREHGLPLLAGVEGVRRAIASSLAYAWAPPPRMKRQAHASALPRPGRDVLHEADARALLSRFGVPAPRGTLVQDAAAAEQAATELGGHVAMKIVSARIAHRSDHGLVALGVPALKARATWHTLMDRASSLQGVAREDCRVLVQEMVQGVAELVVGATCRAGYPPLLTVGFGGVHVELLKDVATRVGPVDAQEAQEMLRELRLYPVLEGYRGAPAADVAAAAAAIAAFSDFAMAAANWLAEAEVNPLVVRGNGEGAAAVDALVVTRPAPADPRH